MMLFTPINTQLAPARRCILDDNLRR